MDLACLPPDPIRILAALMEGPVAWGTPSALAEAAGVALDVAVEALVGLYEAGWVEPWPECPLGVSVTFTPLAAEALRIRIVEVGPRETPRWAGADSEEPRPPRARGVFRDFGAMAALLVDPGPSPDELAEAAEVEAARPPRRRPRAGAWEESRRAALAREKRRRSHRRPSTGRAS